MALTLTQVATQADTWVDTRPFVAATEDDESAPLATWQTVIGPHGLDFCTNHLPLISTKVVYQLSAYDTSITLPFGYLGFLPFE